MRDAGYPAYRRGMTAPVPYVFFDGVARSALEFYRDVFGGDLVLATYADFGRSDGPAEATAHGELRGQVSLAGSDAAEGADSVAVTGMLFSLLGTAEPDTLRGWFDALADGGTVIDPLQLRGWGDYDGQVIDRFGLPWLIGFKG